MKRKLFFIIASLLLFILMVVALTPAAFVSRTVTRFVPDIEFAGASGTLWTGRADYVRVRRLQMNDVNWTLSALPLFTGRVAVQLQFGGNKAFRGKLKLNANVSEQILSDVDIKIPASQVQELSNVPGVQLHGDLMLVGDDIQIKDQLLTRFNGRAQWNKAIVQTPLGQPPLGSYAVEFHTNAPGDIKGVIKDLEGVLDLQGELLLQNQLFTLNAHTRTDLPEQLNRFFSAVGREENGRYRIHFQRSMSAR